MHLFILRERDRSDNMIQVAVEKKNALFFLEKIQIKNYYYHYFCNQIYLDFYEVHVVYQHTSQSQF